MKKIFPLFAFVIFILSIGCNNDQAATHSVETANSADCDDHHHHDPPHGGTLADWGGGAYHVEFTVDHESQAATVYILDSHAESAVPIKADKLRLVINDPSFQIELTPNPQPEDPEGTASQFTGRHEHFGLEREFAGTIIGEVEGTPYAADFDETECDHEDHTH